MADPSIETTYAVVVGIEQYDAGCTWNLDGPASDAIRFLEYLKQQDVPKANVFTYLSPLPENYALKDRAAELSSSVQTPTENVLNNLIERTLPSLKASLFLIFWAGHGVITLEDERRLYTADATAEVKRNVDLNALLSTLRSDVYPNLDRQVLIVDACANYIPDPTEKLTRKTYTAGGAMNGRDQFALFAAGPGEYAKNLNAEKAGLFSRELMQVLYDAPWPLDMSATAETLAARFIELKQMGQTRQTPVTYWFRSPTKSGQFLGDFGNVRVARQPGFVERRLEIPEYTTLVDAMLLVDTMRQAADRNKVMRMLRPQIATTTERSSQDKLDVLAILDKCRYYNAFSELLQAINFFEQYSPPMQNLHDVARQILPAEVPATLP